MIHNNMKSFHTFWMSYWLEIGRETASNKDNSDLDAETEREAGLFVLKQLVQATIVALLRKD